MWINAHLEQAGDQEETHAKPGDWFQPLLQRLDKDQLRLCIERALHGRQHQQGNPSQTANPGDRSEEMQPKCQCQSPGGWVREHYMIFILRI